MNKEYILTIGIPTYNRSQYLDITLNYLSKQNNINKVQILVSDNCSSDNTSKIILKYNELNIKYYRHETNLGVYSNLDSLAYNADGKFLWFFGDDDIMVENSIDYILSILDGNYGLVFINETPYAKRFNQTKAVAVDNDLSYTDGRQLFHTIGMKIQFISSVIVNKNFFKDSVEKFDGKFIKERHILQFMYILSISSAYFVNKVMVYSGYFDDTLLRNSYTNETFLGDETKNEKFNWYVLFFEMPNIYVRYASQNLGFASTMLKTFKTNQDIFFLKMYLFNKKEYIENDKSKQNLRKYHAFMNITLAFKTLFHLKYKILFLLAYFTPPMIIKKAWYYGISLRNKYNEFKN